MISALWTGIAGLSSSQTALDNESNNIANVNTVGYKASRVSFADLMYQDSIGKGSSVTSAEKQYTQGSLNLTGSSYDVALNGDGFFVVSNTDTSGTSELYYTRAGNFRMGDDGTLQDSSGNDVQGWALSAIDTTSDVESTNSNLNSFTDIFTEVAGNQIINYTNKIETYSAKMSDYTVSSNSDDELLSGSGIKTQSTKISDIEALISNYSMALENLAISPNATSSPSISQISTIDFPNGTSSSLDEEGDQIYVYIDGDKITQNYENVTASDAFKSEVDTAVTAGTVVADLDADGTVTDAEYNVLASRVATYKALADEISNITGLNAYTVDPITNEASTNLANVLNGTIKIDSIISGTAFTIGDISEVSGTNESSGTTTTIADAVSGTGEAAVESAMNDLKNAVAGYQQDVYEEEDILADDSDTAITFAVGDTLSYTIGTVTVTSDNTLTTYDEAMEDMIAKINSDVELQLLVEAKDVNGILVVESVNAGEEFSGTLNFYDDSATETYLKDMNLDLSGNTGGNAEFMQIVSSIDQTASKSSLQLKLDTLGITDSSFGEFSVDSNGVITMSQDGMDYAIGQIAIAQFNNNIGLEAVGDNLLEKTTTSGDPIYSINNDNGVEMESETLELSTADLSESLVNLMVFQRAFEANAKSITTADEILTTLIGLKR
ncbi:flagellar hook-basal body complex protein [Poseidonibacter ostreae]|uniref:Flagellar hook protein FlgE n=1 Tax=Poseidonibacter ostreae TaxID=2654171 RepID=A0A6L4WVD8_9BACT|nr:flagellar hook-basal body complex protein [Poseidonibacter ostreae]KAB7886829.1 flagellar hook-basal body complex protein [Poseidonibacter ostreae]KAB7888751.1 flagellar hook-basal body complex protein [Poseidonibacter ostreae]KAB7890472.1 flagellar hook-basal body complex protein [Poseidonibacter ostreae]